MRLAARTYHTACAAMLLGEAGEADVASIEREIEALERDVRRRAVASRELERRHAVIRRRSPVTSHTPYQ